MIKERLSEAELDIMKLLWKENTPLKASEIVKMLFPKYTWKVPTAHVLLSRLAEKGFVDADKSSYSHRFFHVVTEEEYFAGESAALVRKAGRSLPMLFASLIESEDVTDAELLELSEMLDKKLAEIRNKKREGNL